MGARWLVPSKGRAPVPRNTRVFIVALFKVGELANLHRETSAMCFSDHGLLQAPGACISLEAKYLAATENVKQASLNIPFWQTAWRMPRKVTLNTSPNWDLLSLQPVFASQAFGCCGSDRNMDSLEIP